MWRWLLVELFLLAACAPIKAPRVEAPEGFPAAFYVQAARRGEAVYRIEPARSRVEVEVRRGGRLARLGHDHIVTGPVDGFVRLGKVPRADLYLNLFALRVEGDLPPEDLAATRRNMLKSLEAQAFPWVMVRAEGEPPRVSVTLHGVTRPVETRPRLVRQGKGLLIEGEMAIRQSDFGITPFSVLGGALRVRDRLAIRYRLAAAPW